MLAVERRNLILEKLQEDKKVIVSELSQEFQVSEETIRRDLDKLDKDGLAVKSYGGAVLMKIRVWICPLISGRKTIRRENRK
ncbi:MAG: DeoR family transcriptional regulator [Eisenbergiella massiliensis]